MPLACCTQALERQAEYIAEFRKLEQEVALWSAKRAAALQQAARSAVLLDNALRYGNSSDVRRCLAAAVCPSASSALGATPLAPSCELRRSARVSAQPSAPSAPSVSGRLTFSGEGPAFDQ